MQLMQLMQLVQLVQLVPVTHSLVVVLQVQEQLESPLDYASEEALVQRQQTVAVLEECHPNCVVAAEA
jgi:hypothetical protein